MSGITTVPTSGVTFDGLPLTTAVLPSPDKTTSYGPLPVGSVARILFDATSMIDAVDGDLFVMTSVPDTTAGWTPAGSRSRVYARDSSDDNSGCTGSEIVPQQEPVAGK